MSDYNTDTDWIRMMEKMQDIRQFGSTLIKRSIKGGISSAQELDFLSRLNSSQEMLTPQDLCRNMGISKSMISRLVEHLEKKSFIEKVRSEKDKRSYFLCITAVGREELRKTYAYYLEPIYHLRRSIGEDSFEALMKMIQEANHTMQSEENRR